MGLYPPESQISHWKFNTEASESLTKPLKSQYQSFSSVHTVERLCLSRCIQLNVIYSPRVWMGEYCERKPNHSKHEGYECGMGWMKPNWQLSVMKKAPLVNFWPGGCRYITPIDARYPLWPAQWHQSVRGHKRGRYCCVFSFNKPDGHGRICRAGAFKYRWPAVPPHSASLLVTGDFPAKHFSQPPAYYTQQLICNPIKQRGPQFLPGSKWHGSLIHRDT